MPSLPSTPQEKIVFQLNLRRSGISDQAVLRAMEEVPRELFVMSVDRIYAYRDTALGIACGQTISQPFVVAYMTEQLRLRPEHRVLEIGTGSGYQAAILSNTNPEEFAKLQLPAAAVAQGLVDAAEAFAQTFWVAWVLVVITLVPALMLPRKREESHLLDDEGVPPVVVD